jgi:cell division topological specificity factor
MFEFLTRLFRGEPSGAKAKERLRLVLLSDHLALAPDVVESLKTSLLEVISRYVEVDVEHVDVTVEQREHEVALLANVPILSVKNDRPSNGAVHVATAAAASAQPEPSAGEGAATDASLVEGREAGEDVRSTDAQAADAAVGTPARAEAVAPSETEAPPQPGAPPIAASMFEVHASRAVLPATSRSKRRRKKKRAAAPATPAEPRAAEGPPPVA